MPKDIETYLANLSSFKKKKEFLKFCFYLELKAKSSGRLPGTFLVNRQTFLRREVFFVSKLYLDNYAFTDEVNKYYEATQKFVSNLSSSLLKVYSLYKSIFLIYLKSGFYSDNFINFTRKINRDIEEVIEYPSRYSSHFANKEEREGFKQKYGNVSLSNLKYKFYYDMCLFFSFDLEKINQESSKMQKEINYVLEMAIHYANDISNIDNLKRLEELRMEYQIKNSPDNEMIWILKKLESLNTISLVTDYLKSQKIDPKKLFLGIKEYITKYNGHLTHEEQLKLERHLQAKVNVYQRQTLLQRKVKNAENAKKYKENQKITFEQQAQEVILKLIKGNYFSKRAFCLELGIDFCLLEKMVLSVKEHSPELFLEYTKKRILLDENDPLASLSVLEKIIYQMKHGVIIEDEVRPFDILDYFSQTTLNFQEALSLCKSSLGEEETFILSSFISKNRRLYLITDKNIEFILKDIIIFQERGNQDRSFPVETSHTVTEEEKREVLASLKENHIPLYYSVYMAALKRRFSNKKTKKRK